MKTELDDHKSWINAEISLDTHLAITLRSISSEQVFAKIEFDNFLCWQCYDESASIPDESEVVESPGFVSVITKSRYYDYAISDFGWYMELQSPVKLYPIWSEDDIVEVVAYSAPKVSVHT
jgi:hypothetical protein